MHITLCIEFHNLNPDISFLTLFFRDVLLFSPEAVSSSRTERNGMLLIFIRYLWPQAQSEQLEGSRRMGGRERRTQIKVLHSLLSALVSVRHCAVHSVPAPSLLIPAPEN